MAFSSNSRTCSTAYLSILSRISSTKGVTQAQLSITKQAGIGMKLITSIHTYSNRRTMIMMRAFKTVGKSLKRRSRFRKQSNRARVSQSIIINKMVCQQILRIYLKRSSQGSEIRIISIMVVNLMGLLNMNRGIDHRLLFKGKIMESKFKMPIYQHIINNNIKLNCINNQLDLNHSSLMVLRQFRKVPLSKKFVGRNQGHLGQLLTLIGVRYSLLTMTLKKMKMKDRTLSRENPWKTSM